jgi:hypothetical protein
VALPTWVAVGTKSESTAADLTPAAPAGYTTGDTLVIVVESANQTIAFNGSAQGFVEGPSSPQSTGTAGGSGATRLAYFWKTAASGSETMPTLAGAGLDHLTAAVMAFRGCDPTDPFDVSAGDTGSPASTSVTVPGFTTSVTDALCVGIASTRFDNSTGQVGSWANASLANVTQRVNYNSNLGNGGGFGVATGEKATAGVVGTWSATLNNSAEQARIAFALQPPVVAQIVPISTVSAGGWADQAGGTTDLHTPLADDSPSTYVQSPANPVNTLLKVGLTDIGTPGAGDVVIEIDAEQV